INAAFSADGRWIVTASTDGMIRVWDADNGHPVIPPLNHPGLIRADFGPDGQTLLSVSGNVHTEALLRRWELPRDARPREDLLHLTHLLAGHDLTGAGGLTALSFENLRGYFEELRAKYPDDFRVAPAVAQQWREEQIAECLKSGNLPGAFLHQDWL